MFNQHNNKTSALVGALILAGAMTLSSNVNAAVISQSDAIAMSNTNWSNTLSFNQFDSSLGTLDSVSFEITGVVAGDARYESMDSAPSTVTLSLEAMLELARPSGAPLVVVFPVVSVVATPGPFDTVIDWSGTSGGAYIGLTATLSNSASTTSAADLALFTGAGTIDLGVSASAQSMGTGSGNLVTWFTTDASADVTVIYNYSTVPVPAAAWLFGSGLLGLVGMARHKKR